MAGEFTPGPNMARYLEESKRFWDGFDKGVPRGSGSGIIVDLMHDSTELILRNLFTAKYVQELKGGTLLGLAKNWEPPLSRFSFERNAVVASSFNVDRTVHLDPVIKKALADEETVARLDRRIADWIGAPGGAFPTGHELRRRLLASPPGEDGHARTGRLIYDTAIRTDLRATIETLDENLLRSLREGLFLRDLARDIVKRNNVRTVVLGHVEYSPYYFLAEETIRNGGEVFFLWPLVQGTIRRFTSLESLERCRDVNFVDWYGRLFLDNLEKNRRQFDAYTDNFSKRFAIQRRYEGFADVRARLDREQFRVLAGLETMDKPTLVLLSHALSDAVHCNGRMLFDDFGQWIENTLEAGLAMTGVNFVVKVHPLDTFYDRHGFVNQLREQYAHRPNIGILSQHITNQDVARHADLVSTVQGTPGYELVLYGGETIIAGQARYSGLDIANEPATVDEYFSTIERAGNTGMDHEKARDNAMKFSFFEGIAGRCPSVFVEQGYHVTDDYWARARYLMGTRLPYEDPLRDLIHGLITNDRPFGMNPYFLT